MEKGKKEKIVNVLAGIAIMLVGIFSLLTGAFPRQGRVEFEPPGSAGWLIASAVFILGGLYIIYSTMMEKKIWKPFE